jgi:ferredoxin-NADP reductase
MRAPLHALLRTRVAGALVTPLVSPRKLDDYLELVDPTWSLHQVRARIIEVRHETSDVTSLYLEPNENWRGHRAGQHVTLTAVIDGVRHTRCFTLSTAPGAERRLRVTIKAHERGVLSTWARDRASVGDVLTLSQAQGEFVLPTPLPQKLLFISGGSGMTPLLAMAQQLVQAGYRGQLCWLHYERDALPLEDELRTLTAALATARFELVLTGAAELLRAGSRHLSELQLQALVPDWAERELFVCGPRPLLAAASALFGARGLSQRVHSERFQLDWPEPTPSAPGAPRRLVFAKSGRTSDAQPGVSLLDQAEQAGLQPQHGCRMGICHTCVCTKRSGTVRNVRTGLTSDARDEEIQLCIHTPLSDVSLDL